MTLGAFFIFLRFGQHFLLRLLGWSSEVEHNPKMSISLFDDLGDILPHFSRLSLLGLLSQSSEVERNPKNEHFIFQWLRGLFHFFAFPSTFFCSDCSADHHKFECNPKMSISLFDDLGDILPHFSRLSLLRLLSQSSEVERNPKMNISSYDDLGSLFPHFSRILSLWPLADHQKLSIIQKWAFHFLMT